MSEFVVPLEWLFASAVVGLLFVPVGFLTVLVERMYSVLRATLLVGRIQWLSIVALIAMVVLLPLITWLISGPSLNLLGTLLVVLAAVLGTVAGRVIARWDSRDRPRILAAIADISLSRLGSFSKTRTSEVVSSSEKFVANSPPHVGDLLGLVLVIFNSPWTSLAVGHGFRSFVHKGKAEREAYLARWATDTSLRYALEFVKVVLAYGIYDQHFVWRAIGYCIPIEGEHEHGQDVFSPYHRGDAASRGIHGNDRFRCWYLDPNLQDGHEEDHEDDHDETREEDHPPNHEEGHH